MSGSDLKYEYREITDKAKLDGFTFLVVLIKDSTLKFFQLFNLNRLHYFFSFALNINIKLIFFLFSDKNVFSLSKYIYFFK